MLLLPLESVIDLRIADLGQQRRHLVSGHAADLGNARSRKSKVGKLKVGLGRTATLLKRLDHHDTSLADGCSSSQRMIIGPPGSSTSFCVADQISSVNSSLIWSGNMRFLSRGRREHSSYVIGLLEAECSGLFARFRTGCSLLDPTAVIGSGSDSWDLRRIVL